MSFIYGDERITFECKPRSLVNGRILIKVHPDCRVVVSAPQDTDDQQVLNAVEKRGRWIYQQLRDFRKQLEYITPRQYISGESHYYLGKQYMLKVIVAPSDAQGVKMLRGKLEVTLRHKSAEKVLKLLTDWYKARAREVFAKRLSAMLEQALWVSDSPPLRILTMQTQWGSCSPNGRVTLNPNLVKAPGSASITLSCMSFAIWPSITIVNASTGSWDRLCRTGRRPRNDWMGWLG